MKAFRQVALAAIVAVNVFALPACTRKAGDAPADRVAPPAASPRKAASGESVATVTERTIPNVPGKRLVVKAVDYAPGGYSASHRHAKSAFIFAYVVSGEIRSQVNDEPVRVYKAGEHWFENPDSHHRVSENASATHPAKLIAVFVVDEDEKDITVPDK